MTDPSTPLIRSLLPSSPRRRPLAGERGFTLVEVLVAASVLLMGIMSTLGVFTSAKHTTQSAQRHEVAANVAERELDQLRTLDYAVLVLSDNIEASGDDRHPVSGGYLAVRECEDDYPVCLLGDYWEAQVPPDAGVDLDPVELFEVGGDGDPGTPDGGAVTGNIYRYVTWRVDGCQFWACSGRDSKRISVAVTIDAAQGLGPARPVWVSTVVNDPDAGPADELNGPVGDADLSGERFYPFDRHCGMPGPWYVTADHETRNTAAGSTSPSANSTCWGNTGQNKPDLMLTERPPMDPIYDPALPPYYKYSANPGDTENYWGLRMRDDQGAYAGDCEQVTAGDTTYSWPEGDPNGLNKFNVHRWVTEPLTGFVLSRRVGLSLYSRTLSGNSTRGVICVTLLSRLEVDGELPVDTLIDSFAIDRPNWNPPGKWAAFTRRWDLPDTDSDGEPGPVTVPDGERLVLAISMHASSSDDLLFAYNHPAFPSHLTIDTTTPIATQ